MHIQTSDVPIKVNAPGAVARQQKDFGDASGYGKIGVEHFKMDAGTDIAPLLQGLENDLCQAPHWGYLIKGDLTVTYTDGGTEDTHAGDMFYWPPGHTVKVNQDAEFVLFSPQNEHTIVLDHINSKLGA
jgi:hypothetical protein